MFLARDDESLHQASGKRVEGEEEDGLIKA